MSTAKTKTIAVRVPVALLDAVSADADELDMTPGTFLRRLLEARYSSRRDARKSVIDTRNTDDEERQEVNLPDV